MIQRAGEINQVVELARREVPSEALALVLVLVVTCKA